MRNGHTFHLLPGNTSVWLFLVASLHAVSLLFGWHIREGDAPATQRWGEVAAGFAQDGGPFL